MDSIASSNRISPPGNSPAPLPFPAGLRVLVVDDNPTCLKFVEKLLQSCLYNVTTCSSAKVALSILREKKKGFDLVLSDVHMPDMDGFKLLEHIGLEMDLPVIMMSIDGGKEVVMKGVTHGACDYLIKPVRIEAVRTLWQHVVRKKRNELKDAENSGSLEESDKQKRGLDDSDNASSVNEGNWKNGKRRKEGKEEEDDEAEEREDSSNLKKQRVVWSAELHQQFVNAVSQLGVEKAVPKKILELMNVPGITRENVASHLQKYRLYLRRLSVPNHQGRFETQLAYGSCNPLDGYDLQALQVSGQLPPQSLVAMHPGARRISNSASGISSADSVSFFNPDEQTASSKLRSAQLTQSQQAIQSYGNMGLLVKEEAPGFLNLSPTSVRMNSSLSGVATNGHPNNPFVMQMTQRGQSFSHSQPQGRGQNNTLTSTMGQQIPTGRGGSTINGNTGLIGTYANSASYSPVTQAQYGQFQNSGMAESNGNFYPVVSNIGATGMFQEIVPAAGIVQAMNNSTNLKGAKEFIPSYSLFSDLHQSKSQDWKLQSNIDFCSSNSAHQDLNAAALSGGGTGRNTCTVRKEIISVRAEIEQKFLVDNSRRVRAEGMPNSNAQDLLFSDNIIPNELMSVISRQPQEGIGQDDEFNFDGFPLDNISV